MDGWMDGWMDGVYRFKDCLQQSKNAKGNIKMH